MKNDAGEKSFDVMKWLRATRARILPGDQGTCLSRKKRRWDCGKDPEGSASVDVV